MTPVSASLVKVTFSGATSAGSIPVSDLKAGDIAIGGTFTSSGGDGAWWSFFTGYEPVVSVDGSFQQTSPLDWSTVTFTVSFIRGA